MSSGQRKRGWRQCLADSYEKQYGPLDDPVPTFGAKLVTFPSTPTLPMCFTGPDPEFLERLDRRLYAIENDPVPKCLQGLRFVDPEDEESAAVPISMSCSDNDTDEEHRSPLQRMIREVTVRTYAKAGIDIIAVEANRRTRRRAREERRKARAAKSINTKSLPSSHDHAIEPPSNTDVDIETDAVEHQTKHQKRKRRTEDEEAEDSTHDAQPRRKVAKPSDTTIARPKRQIRPSFKPQTSYSPPQTPSPTEREYTQRQAVPSSPESPIAQQPTPEVDNSSRYLSQDSPTAGEDLSAG
ncbi:hypothetical protein FOVG_19460 [Fusarium oxysporum f. sp. pisi HDV247]|uniref:Uncharacterized protein n=1 Tax=Fusarium oxysporum f. sp. pisi HDV247 TaxID=1080344 RepID=W9NE32_FUSOX|nr:hypothetical protein FOVG_19460 [Fusarium oxysporum f. sp. pisi HDV247]EXA28971.1 hypothetical protein FOVG_19460 [Fusarium oxysporum f. sp. pisi HDV247]